MTITIRKSDLFIKAFKCCFFFIAGYMIILQILRYFENKDTSTIAYKKFNESPSDLYPTFTICFEDNLGGVYNNKYIAKSLGITRTDYVNILLGKDSHDINVVGVNDTGDITKTALKLDVRNVTLQFHDFFDDFWVTGFNKSEKFVRKYNKGSTNVPFYVSYQDPVKICFTRETLFEKGVILKEDQLWTKKIKSWRTLLSMFAVQTIYLHQSGNLMRSFSKAVYERKLTWVYGQNHYVSISPVLVSVLRKRPDANLPCNPKLNDDDEQVRIQIMNQVGCIPPYWKLFHTEEVSFNDCESSAQLKEIYQKIENYQPMMLNYDHPCNEMRIVNVVQWESKSYPGIAISYVDEMYEEVVNERNFGFEMFWSSVGGFVGMFLGYSLLQTPEMIFKLCKLAKT